MGTSKVPVVKGWARHDPVFQRGDEMEGASEGEGGYRLHLFPQRERRGG